MEKKDVQKGFELAEKELNEKRVQEVKEIVKKTLEKLELAKQKKQTIEDEIKYLKMDIDDLRAGRLDLIEERQLKDPKAKKISVVIIVKEREVVIREREVPVYPWVQPYVIQWNYTSAPDNTYYCDCSDATVTLNGNVAKYNTIGTYTVFGKPVTLR